MAGLRSLVACALASALLGALLSLAVPVSLAHADPVAPAADPRLAEAEAAIRAATQAIAQARYAEAKASAQRAIDLIEATLGKDVPQLAEPLSLLGDALRMTGDVAGGEALQRRALALYDKVGAQETAWYSSVLYRLGDVLRMRGKYAEALVVQERMAALLQKLYGPASGALAVTLSAEAELQRMLGHTDLALPLHDRAVAMSKAANGPRHAYTASLMQARASTLSARGEYAQAVRGFEEALAIMQEALGSDHMWTGQVAQNLALELVHTGDFARADALFERALDIDKKTLGPTHPFVAAVLANQGDVALARNRLDLAAEKLREAFAVAVAAYGEEHPEVVSIAEHYCKVLRESGWPKSARRLAEQTLQMREKLHGPDHPDVVQSLILLAELVLDEGDVDAAERYADRSMRLSERAHGPGHVTAIPILDLYARIDSATSDKERLIQRRRQALQIHLATNGPGHPSTAAAQTNLGNALLPDDATQAVALMRSALQINLAVFGPEHRRTAQAHGNLGATLAIAGDLPGAQKAMELGYALDKKALGESDPSVAADLQNLATLAGRLGQLDKAETLLRASLAMYQETLGKDHGAVGGVLFLLADLLDGRGLPAQGLPLRARATAIADRELGNLLWTGDEQRKVSVLQAMAPDTAELLNHALRLQPGNAVAGQLALQAVLRRHARAVDVLADTLDTLRRKMSPEDRAAVDGLAEKRSRLSVHVLRGPGPGDQDSWQKTVDDLKSQVRAQEAELSRRSAVYRDRTAAEATVEAVQAALDPTSALAEYVVWTPQAHVERGIWQDRDLPQRLAVCLVRHTGAPKWYDLGEVSAVDSAVIAARRAVRSSAADPVADLQALSRLVLLPLATELVGVQRLRIAADGALLVAPLAALPLADGTPLGQALTVSYVGSGRELLARFRDNQARQPPLVVANPEFGPKGKAAGGERDAELRSLVVEPLPGTAAEAKTLARLFPKAKVLTGSDARESALAAAKGPQFLHVATHGFFQTAARATASATQKAPLLRSGLLLAGFNRHRSGSDDGVLTALEAASLDLQGTQLAVLSACNTGVGDLRAGDGVQGLRRALAIAGAQTVVMSLWSVDDAATGALMSEFYTQWQAGKTRSAALRAAQENVRKQPAWAHPYFWAAFVAAGAE